MWLTIKELSCYIKIKEKTLYYLVGKRKIPHYRIGKIIRFKREEIAQWLEGKKAKSFEECIDKFSLPTYTSPKGRPGHLRKEA